MKKTTNYLSLVIKTKKTREQDLLVTLLTAEQGKILVVAKGVGKLSSHKRPYLESGNLIYAQLVPTKSLSLLTQATLVNEVTNIRQDLNQLKRFLLFLEIIDQLMVDEEIDIALFKQILYLRELFLQDVNNAIIKKQFAQILAELGYLDQEKPLTSVSGLVSQICNRQLCSYDYLSVS